VQELEVCQHILCRKASKVEAWIQSVLVDKRYYSETPVGPTTTTSPGNEKGAIPVKPLSDVLAGGQNVKLTVTPSANSNGGAARYACPRFAVHVAYMTLDFVD
jgi:hypothetical protein